MADKAKPEYVKAARKLVGKKAGLVGGGMSAQYVYIVQVVRVTRDGHAVVKTKGWSYPDSKTVEFQLFLRNWRLEPLLKGFGRLPLGRYDLLAGVRDRPEKPVVKLPRIKR